MSDPTTTTTPTPPPADKPAAALKPEPTKPVRKPTPTVEIAPGVGINPKSVEAVTEVTDPQTKALTGLLLKLKGGIERTVTGDAAWLGELKVALAKKT